MKDRSYEEEMEDYENSLIWGMDWREVFKEINKEMNMDKLHAIAFGEWILKHDSYPITDDQWLVAGGEDPVTREEIYSYYTTEELYNEFLKSI